MVTITIILLIIIIMIIVIPREKHFRGFLRYVFPWGLSLEVELHPMTLEYQSNVQNLNLNPFR